MEWCLLGPLSKPLGDIFSFLDHGPASDLSNTMNSDPNLVHEERVYLQTEQEQIEVRGDGGAIHRIGLLFGVFHRLCCCH